MSCTWLSCEDRIRPVTFVMMMYSKCTLTVLFFLSDCSFPECKQMNKLHGDVIVLIQCYESCISLKRCARVGDDVMSAIPFTHNKLRLVPHSGRLAKEKLPLCFLASLLLKSVFLSVRLTVQMPG